MTLPQKPAGGWSAHGQPCDGFHHLYRRLCNHYADACLGYHEPGRERADKPITLGLHGQKVLQTNPQDSVKCLVWAWQQLGKHHKTLCWAWTSRGLVTDEEMKQLRPEVFEDGFTATSKLFSEIVPGVPLIVPSLAWKLDSLLGGLVFVRLLWLCIDSN